MVKKISRQEIYNFRSIQSIKRRTEFFCKFRKIRYQSSLSLSFIRFFKSVDIERNTMLSPSTIPDPRELPLDKTEKAAIRMEMRTN